MRNKPGRWKCGKLGWLTIITVILIALASSRPWAEKKLARPLQVDYGPESPEFSQTLGNVIGQPFVGGNSIQELINGDQIFPEMLKAIKNATNSITFENFIWRSGKLSDQFIQALTEKAIAGIKVHCIADGVGTMSLEEKDQQLLKQSGVEFIRFNKPGWHRLFRVNHRTHRKMMVVDGRIGFIGGICIADEWTGNATEEDHWRDTHFKVEGPIVAQMQGVFSDNYLQTTSSLLHGSKYFPALANVGPIMAQCYDSGPRDGAENAHISYLYAIASSKKSIRISHSYFVPDRLAQQELLAARKRGVTIEVITPGKIDANVVRNASRSYWKKLLEAGVEFYEYKPALYHCKVMIVDDCFVSAGSVNFDDRSFRVNDEANINVLDKEFAARQTRVFEEDKSKSRRFTMEDYDKRGVMKKTLEWLASLLHAQL